VINEINELTAKDTALEALTKQYGAAVKAGDKDKSHELRVAMRTQRRNATAKLLESALAKNDYLIDAPLIRAELARVTLSTESGAPLDTSSTNDVVSQLLLSQVLMLEGGGVAEASLLVPSAFGSASAKGAKVKLTLRTINAATCLPLVAHWLGRQGCSDIHYRITPVAVASEDESE
jgi:hypothetical protein